MVDSFYLVVFVYKTICTCTCVEAEVHFKQKCRTIASCKTYFHSSTSLKTLQFRSRMSWLYWCSFDLELKGMTSNLWNLIYEGRSLASFHEKNNFAKRNRGTIMINWMLLISNCNSSYGTGEKKKHSISAFQHLQRGILETTFKVVSLDLICFFCPPKQFFV